MLQKDKKSLPISESCHSSVVPCFHGSGFMEPQKCGFMVPQFCSSMFPWFWIHGTTETWIHGSIVLYFHGSGFMEPQKRGFMIPQFCSSMVLDSQVHKNHGNVMVYVYAYCMNPDSWNCRTMEMWLSQYIACPCICILHESRFMELQNRRNVIVHVYVYCIYLDTQNCRTMEMQWSIYKFLNSIYVYYMNPDSWNHVYVIHVVYITLLINTHNHGNVEMCMIVYT